MTAASAPAIHLTASEASIEGQLRDCKDYAEKNGITVVGTYIDRAYSAKTDDRPDFQRMIKDSGKKIFDVVLVWKLDRFARNRYDAVNYKYQLEKNGVHLVSAMEPISQGPEGIMVESMLIGMAEYYVRRTRPEKWRGECGKRQSSATAVWCRWASPSASEDRLYHIDPETAPIVQEISPGMPTANRLAEDCRLPGTSAACVPAPEAVREEQLLPDLPQPPLHRRIPLHEGHCDAGRHSAI